MINLNTVKMSQNSATINAPVFQDLNSTGNRKKNSMIDKLTTDFQHAVSFQSDEKLNKLARSVRSYDL